MAHANAVGEVFEVGIRDGVAYYADLELERDDGFDHAVMIKQFTKHCNRMGGDLFGPHIFPGNMHKKKTWSWRCWVPNARDTFGDKSNNQGSSKCNTGDNPWMVAMVVVLTLIVISMLGFIIGLQIKARRQKKQSNQGM